MRHLVLPETDARLPVIGQGSWGLGESRSGRSREVEALRLGISLGMTLIDTAELYGAGRAESVVGDAIHDCREDVFLVTKVWPSHARRADVQASVRASLDRLRTDHVDAVLLHWPTRSVPLRETLLAFADLQHAGLARHVGVSNFDARWLRAATAAGVPDVRLSLDQVPYSPADRAVEPAVLPYCAAQQIVVMAYSPLGHGRSSGWRCRAALAQIAAARDATPAQVALAWLTARGGVVAIPKATRPEHVRENAAAGDLELTPAEVDTLNVLLGPPKRDSLRLLPPIDPFFRLASWAIGRTREKA